MPWQTWQPACGVRASVAWDETQPAGWTAPGGGASEFLSEQPPVSSKRIKSMVMHDAEMKFFIFILLPSNCEVLPISKETTPMERFLCLFTCI